MQYLEPINPVDFVARLEPMLATNDLNGLLHTLQNDFSSHQLKSLMTCPCGDARKVATLALGLVGGCCCIPYLTLQLADPDPMANQIAEHALWSIWFRMSSPAANDLLSRGTRSMETAEFQAAEQLYTQAIAIDSQFSEAYNQRAILYYLRENFEDSISDCKSAIELMPCHFGAWAGMGHCYTQLNQISQAIGCYEKALQINPRMDCIREALGELRKFKR